MQRKNSKKSSGIIWRLLKDSRIRRTQVVLIILIILGSKFCLTMAPHVSGDITDLIVSFVGSGQPNMSFLFSQCLLLAFLYLAGRGGGVLISNILLGISQKTVKVLRDKSYNKLNRLPIRNLDQYPIGDLISRLTNDMQSVSSLIEGSLRIVVGEGVLLLGVLIMMLRISPILTLIYLIVLPLGFVLSTLIIKICTKSVRRQTQLLGKLTALTEDSYRNHQMIKAYSCEGPMMESFLEINTDLSGRYIKTNFLTGFIMPVSVLTINICFILECILGSMFLINGNISLGDFQAFLIYGNMILTPLSDFSAAVNGIQMGKVSAERIYEFLDQEEEEDETEKAMLDPDSVEGEITFQHVEFSYSPEQELMKDVSFHVPKGKTVAIVGPTGAGKTTLVNLLMRFYEIQKGEILLDGCDIRRINRQSLRKAFGIVLQDSWIFDGTVADNIAYGKPEATIEEVKRAAERVQCDPFIEKMPEQYDTYIHAEQMQLSAGEKQLISIARAMIIDPPILILDEATSHVDTRTEVLITKAMTELMKNRTCFIIAHRLATIRNADMILYMENGDIVEVGDHDTLMNMGGKYAGMYRQASVAEEI